MKKKPRFGTRGCGLPRGKWITLFMLMLSFSMTSMALTARAGTVALPKTGQVTCYDEAGTEISCTGTGQDGEIQAGVAWPDPRFTDNGDGTITDYLTGLIWLKDANCMATHYPEFDLDETPGDGLVGWKHAIGFASNINGLAYPNCSLGYTDWRLPNALELESLFHAGRDFMDTWLTSQGFNNVVDNYWSSSTLFDDPNFAFWLSFVDGETGGVDEAAAMAVWPVRGTTSGPAQLWKTGQTTGYATGDDGYIQAGVAWPDPRFTNNGDGTITDNLTGLTWLRDMNCIQTHYPSFDTDGTTGNGAVSWQHALDFVGGINSGTYPSCGAGLTDWRLPNRKELKSICHHEQETVTWLVSQGFTNPDLSDTYWSSTSALGSTGVHNHAFVAAIGYSIGHNPKTPGTALIWVWPVRTATVTEHISAPSILSGTTLGWTATLYSFSAGNSVSTFKHPVEYQFDWGDQTTSEWSASGSASHSWSLPGIYNITAQARCTIHNEVISSWSGELSITINPPPGPDLTGTWTYLTQTCKTSKSGTKCKIKGELKIQNVGDQDASSSVVKFYLSDDKAFDESEDTFLKKSAIGKIKAKAHKIAKLTYTLTTTALDKYIIAVIDAGNTVKEQYETNNNIVFGPIL